MKSVIITGSNRGIGLETAIAFGRAGYKVYGTMRSIESSAELAERAQKESLAISMHQLDVNSDESVRSCIRTIIAENGPVDILVNNAGIERRGSVEETALSVYQEVMNTNYFGPIRCAQAVIPEMRAKGGGCIINVTSVAGRIPVAPFGPYNGSKFALEAVSECMAIELKPFKIRVAIIEPGIINTDMAQGIKQVDSQSEYPNQRRISDMFAASLKNPVHPKVVADKILQVAEDENSALRHPVGPDAIPFLEWRASMTDEEWVAWHAASDDDWYDALESDVGMDARQKI
jgi:NAD(P)-dependent dehydrogenase (short-subunit alcohol dehydrogenase family)